MNKENFSFVIIGIFIGLSVGYLIFEQRDELSQRNADLSKVSKKLFIAKQNNVELENQLKILSNQQASTPKVHDKKATQENSTKRNETSSVVNNQQDTYQQAIKALEQDDLEYARALFNKLLLSDEPQDYDKAVSGLLDVFNSTIKLLDNLPDQSNTKLWVMYEMHKLSPSNAIKADLITLSNQAYSEATQYLKEGNLLAGADIYASLMHLSKLMDYKVNSIEGQPLQGNDFEAELKNIQSQPTYLRSLQSRAENNLYNGASLEKSQVFWDYTNLATLKGNEALKQGEFREEFIQATLLHFNYLKAMNQPSEIKARQDYIRWVFPDVMKDLRISNFR